MAIQKGMVIAGMDLGLILIRLMLKELTVVLEHGVVIAVAF